MKYLLVSLIILFSISMSFLISYEDPNLSQEERLVNKILSLTADLIEKKYKLRAAGVGAAMPGGDIQRLSLVFNSRNRLSQKQLRNILIESSKEFLERINSNLEIRRYLNVYPFTLNNIKIVIFNHDFDGMGLFDPEISVSDISDGFLKYRTNDPNNPYKYKNEYKETYEEALKLIQDE